MYWRLPAYVRMDEETAYKKLISCTNTAELRNWDVFLYSVFHLRPASLHREIKKTVRFWVEHSVCKVECEWENKTAKIAQRTSGGGEWLLWRWFVDVSVYRDGI